MRYFGMFLPVLLILTMVACAKPPQTEINEARSAVESVTSYEVFRYAPDSLKEVDEALQAMQAELDAEGGKIALFRNYRAVKARALDVMSAVGKARSDAARGKEAAEVTAGQLNSQGMHAYELRDYEAAADYFRQAVGLFPDHARANYNLACVMALQFNPSGDACSDHWAEEDIFAHLRHAVLNDPAILEEAVMNAEFFKFHDRIGYWLAIGSEFKDPELVYGLLIGVDSWHGRWGGTGPEDEISFSYDLSFVITLCDYDENFQVKADALTGTFEVGQDGIINLRFTDGRINDTSIDPMFGYITIEQNEFYAGPSCAK